MTKAFESQRSRYRNIPLLMLMAVALVLLLLPITAAQASSGHRVATYEVTLENLTANQILSPPLFLTGSNSYRLFRVGSYASDELRMIAESGNNGPAAAQAMASRRVNDVVAMMAPILPGQSVTVTVEARRGSRLSLAAMLVSTNDGFTGADRVRLPRGERTITRYLNTYDAGTEMNNELGAYVPGPPIGGMLRDPEHKRIAMHAGILGIGDLSIADFGWEDPSALLTITMVDDD